MASYHFLLLLITSFLVVLSPVRVVAQVGSTSPGKGPAAPKPSSTASTTAVSSTRTSSGTATSTATTTSSSVSSATSGAAPDVYLNVPNLSVGRIELDVDNLKADLNLNAQVANLVSINAGVAVSIEKVNITIADVQVQLELVVRLGHLVDIVNRVFESLDLNPLLITALNDVTSIVHEVVGVVDGLLGSITQGGQTINFLVDNLGNIVSSVLGTGGQTVDTIVGNYVQNMTFTGDTKQLANGLVQKTYSYAPLNALVNIVFNTLGQFVQATTVKQSGGGSGTSTTTSGKILPTNSATA